MTDKIQHVADNPIPSETLSAIEEQLKNFSERVRQESGTQQLPLGLEEPNVTMAKEMLSHTRKLNDGIHKDNNTIRNLRIIYGCLILVIMVVQLVCLDWIFHLVGTGYLKYKGNTLNVFVSGTFVEIIGVVLVIAQSIFPRNLFPRK